MNCVATHNNTYKGLHFVVAVASHAHFAFGSDGVSVSFRLPASRSLSRTALPGSRSISLCSLVSLSRHAAPRNALPYLSCSLHMHACAA